MTTVVSPANECGQVYLNFCVFFLLNKNRLPRGGFLHPYLFSREHAFAYPTSIVLWNVVVSGT